MTLITYLSSFLFFERMNIKFLTSVPFNILKNLSQLEKKKTKITMPHKYQKN